MTKSSTVGSIAPESDLPIFQESVALLNERGLHARAAAKIVKIARDSGCAVRVHRGNQSASGYSIIDLMMLGASFGETITFEVSGNGAPKTLQALCQLVYNTFGELS